MLLFVSRRENIQTGIIPLKSVVLVIHMYAYASHHADGLVDKKCTKNRNWF
jgi:hypothetical protein